MSKVFFTHILFPFLLFLLGSYSPLRATDTILVQNKCFASSYFSARVGDGRSYQNGYQSVGMFSTYSCGALQQYFLFDLQLMRVDLGRYACSYGAGWRMCFHDGRDTFGINVFYDARSSLKALFNQLGLGIELFSKCWDVRINGYLPVGNDSAFETSEILDFGDGYLALNKQEQTTMWGIDVEVGKDMGLWNMCTMHVGLGPYFYNTFGQESCASNAILGGVARAALFLNSCLAIELFVSYDHFFKTKIQGELTLNITWSKCCRLFYPQLKVQRNRVITTRKTCSWTTNY